MLSKKLERLTLERKGPSESVLWIALANPAMRNALDDTMQRELIDLMSEIANDGSIHCVVIRGEGSVFCSGGDISAFDDMTPARGHWYSVHRGEALQTRIAQLGKPVIAAVDGWCLAGGSELALMSDFIYATASAKFGVTEIRIGLLPGWGGLTRLPKAVGLRRAREMLYRGEIIDCAEAHRIGLVNRVFESSEALYEAVDLVANEIAEKSQTAVRAAREVTALVANSSESSAMAIERGALVHLLSTPDVKEGVAAFIEKRPARFNQNP